MEFNAEQLNIIFPFHLLVNNTLGIIHWGNGLKKICPEIEKGKRLDEFLVLNAPVIPLTYSDILQNEKKLFLFSVKERDLQVKGQVIYLNENFLFIFSPVITDSAILKKFGITLKDLAIYDSMADTLFLLNAQKMALKESKDFYLRLLDTNQKLEKVNNEIAEMNEALEQKVMERTEEIQKTLNDLKSAQAQLIQSEKMASLGELTAGIAHEIQNPLNFVNNFSEVNAELIDEMQDELNAGHPEEAITISNSIKNNQEKINFHGKRADAIVKGMLQHSRSSSGVKEPTDINTLADEYLRLAYHGLRAKDKSFNATMKTDFDPNIGFIHVVPQDIGRVILNLITNAFYAVTEKKKQDNGTPYPLKGGIAYEPLVSVTTKKQFPLPGGRGSIEISVIDNGNGIPKNTLDKIFQPFFTTKPTGQGTGLGLSLSYDIVKAHGGELKVETKEGEYTAFIITLPI